MDLAKTFVSIRPWSFIMSFNVLIISYVYAYYLGYKIDLVPSILALIGVILLHGAGNWFNDYGDYLRGVDRLGTGTVVYRPHPIVEKIFTPKNLLKANITLIIVASLIGLYLAFFFERILVIPLGLAGALAGILYSMPEKGLKYHGLGEILIFITWGVLMSLGGFYVATGSIDPNILLVSAPLGLFITAVLFANNMRDLDHDREVGIKTLAGILGGDRSRIFYSSLLLGALLITVVEAVMGVLPYLSLLTLLSLPKIYDLIKLSKKPPENFDPETSKVINIYTPILVATLLIDKLFL